MTAISVTVRPPVAARLLFDLARACGLAIAEAKARIGAGRPLIHAVPFMNDHDEVAARLDRVTALLDASGASCEIREHAGGATPGDPIPREVLLNILAGFRPTTAPAPESKEG